MTNAENINVQDVQDIEVTENEQALEESTTVEKKRNPIGKFLDKRQERKDVEIELLASMDRETRHTYVKKKRRRRIKKVALGVAIVTVAYILGRTKSSKGGSDTVEELPDIILEPEYIPEETYEEEIPVEEQATEEEVEELLKEDVLEDADNIEMEEI